MRTRLPLLLGTGAGLFVVVTNALPHGAGLALEDAGDRWVIASSAAALLLGVISLTRLHLANIGLRRPGWVYSAVLLVALYGYGLLTVVGSPTGGAAKWVFVNVMAPIYASMFGLIAFFITTAAYRACRVRALEGAVLFGSALVALIGLSPLGDALLPSWRSAGEWLLGVPVTGAYRAIQVGAAIGALATALRVLAGLERSHLGGGA